MELTSRHMEVLEGAAMFVGTVGRDGRPDCVRCFGAKLADDRQTLRVLLPTAWAANVVANLSEGRWVAFSFTDPTTYASFQAKGRVLRLESPTDEDREIAARHQAQFANKVISVGVHESARFYSHMPGVAIVFRLERLYCQTPGPGAGDLVGGAS